MIVIQDGANSNFKHYHLSKENSLTSYSARISVLSHNIIYVSELDITLSFYPFGAEDAKDDNCCPCVLLRELMYCAIGDHHRLCI